jgi:hypothetical protein
MNLLPQREATLGRALALLLAFTAFAVLAPASPAAAAGDEQATRQTYCNMQSAHCAPICQPGGAAVAYAASAPYPGPYLAAHGARRLPAPKSTAGTPRGVLLAAGPPRYLLHRRLLL